MVQAFMNFPDAAAAFRAGLRCGVDCERLLPKVRCMCCAWHAQVTASA